MAKQAIYALRLNVQRAEFYDNGQGGRNAAVAYGGPANLATVDVACTRDQVEQRMKELSQEYSWSSHAVLVGMRYPSDRKMPGLAKIKPIYNDLEA